MSTKETYKASFDELQKIITEMESGEIGVDELASKVKRASVLIQKCKEILSKTEVDVQKILDGLEEN
ncbi:MAG: exodeoxyribonuclease VII small subunit [Bacteroidetes bacterium]|jgi:exodeoxyribonuclease VII small subunit|nr:exodeoxyribonuclease VII small subunit [Bacteroidota bacterium]MDA0931551.1 exodeoxyribonuclease VII small subunit [Bacteroidota bacterium]